MAVGFKVGVEVEIGSIGVKDATESSGRFVVAATGIVEDEVVVPITRLTGGAVTGVLGTGCVVLAISGVDEAVAPAWIRRAFS